MHVLATAGHVDHGKSTLVRALTGMEPDRYAEEQRRGLTIDLGFAWADVGGREIAFVDVPGHERFVPTMLAGVGPVPAVVLVVAADGGWMPQSQEHLDALDALGVRHGLLVVTRSDLADPAPATAEARERLAGTSLAGIDAVAVSAVDERTLAPLRQALVRLVDGLPAPDVDAPVRLWVDRVFTIRGSGTVVTGTLAAGTVQPGDRLEIANAPSGSVRSASVRSGSVRSVSVRSVQSLGRASSRVGAVARVALNLRGTDTGEVSRGDALVTPGAHRLTDVLDVRWPRALERLPPEALLHVGSAQVPTRIRPLGDRAARLQLARALPLRIGDVGLLRDPGRRVVLTGFTVLDVDPPALARRGAARERALALHAYADVADAGAELARRRVVRRADLVAMGVDPQQAAVVGVGDARWAVAPDQLAGLRSRLADVLAQHAAAHPLEDGVPVEVARQALDLPDQRLVHLAVSPPLVVREGRVVRSREGAALPPAVAAAVEQVRTDLQEAPFAAPDANRLRDLGLGPRELAAAVRVGALAKVADGVYLAPEGLRGAVQPLRALPQPFTSSQARQAWGTTRRVAMPLLERLDHLGVTTRLPDDTRVLTRR